MAFASYLGQFDVDAETNRVLDVALEMTRAAQASVSRTLKRRLSNIGLGSTAQPLLI